MGDVIKFPKPRKNDDSDASIRFINAMHIIITPPVVAIDKDLLEMINEDEC